MEAAKPFMMKSLPPLIDTVKIPGVKGMIGITSCPGMRDDFIFDLYCESLIDDLLAIRSWGASVVITLLEDTELQDLGVRELGRHVVDLNMVWLQLPVRNMAVPDERFDEKWRVVLPSLCNLLREGQRILIHCREGIGRAGLVAARLLLELGVPAAESLKIVRRARPGSLMLASHEKYCCGLLPSGQESQTAAKGLLASHTEFL